MPTRTASFCDNCGDEISNEKRLLIYSVSFWSKKYNKSIKVDYSHDRDEAAMFCDGSCMGNYITGLIHGRWEGEL